MVQMYNKDKTYHTIYNDAKLFIHLHTSLYG